MGKFIQANSYKKITRNSLKVFFCAEEGFKVCTALLLFAVNCKRSLPTPFCEFWHVTEPFNIGMRTWRIRPIMRRITLTLTRKKPTHHKHSHTSLRLCRMLEWTFMHLFANGLYKWIRQVCALAATWARLNRFLYFCMGIKVANFCRKVLNPQVLISRCLLYLNV